MIRLLALPILCCGTACAGDPDSWPTRTWPETTPEAQGVSSAGLLRTLEAVDELSLTMHSLLVIRHGAVVLDARFWPFGEGTRHDVASCTKSVTATLVGTAIDRGLLELRDEVGDVLDVSEPLARVRVRDLLEMRSGVGPADDWLLGTADDRLAYVGSLPRHAEPGASFVYSSGDTYLLMALVDAVTGDAAAFARDELFGPLGIVDFAWPDGPDGVPTGWGDLHLHPRDAAKLGMLYQYDGRWDDAQLVPRRFVRRATREHSDQPSDVLDYGYGWQWWTLGDGRFAAQGRNGQFVVVDPDLDLIVVTTGGTPSAADDGYGTLLVEHLLPSVRSDEALPPDPEALAALEARAAELATPPTPSPTTPLPQIAHTVSGVRYGFEPNDVDLEALRLTFDDSAVAQLEFQASGVSLQLPLGLDGVPRVSADDPARDGLTDTLDPPVAGRAEWNEDTLVLELDEIENINRWQIRARFDGSGNTVDVELDDLLYSYPTVAATGRAETTP